MMLEEEIAQELARQISAEIDAEILFNIFCQGGWHVCQIDPWRHNSLTTVIQWCKQYAGEHGWAKAGNQYAFKDARVATMFRLRWSSD